MNNIISIKDLQFKYDDKEIFNDFSLDINKGDFITILGPNGSGKSTLIKLILGLVRTHSYISVDGIVLNTDTIKDIRKKIGVVFENPDNQFVAETVMDDLAFSLENMNFEKKEIRKRIKEIGELLDIEKIMEKEPHRLSGGEKQIVALGGALSIKPSILILDEAFTMIDPLLKEKMLLLLKKLNQEGLTIINVTHDSEESLYGNKILLMNDGKIVSYDEKEVVLKDENTFNSIGVELPFMASLSIKLNYYGLINEIFLDMDELVNKLWK